MGTSTPFGGPGGNTPLVPSWLGGGEGSETPPTTGNGDIQPPEAVTSPSPRPPIPPVADPARFMAARNNFSRFAGSGGSDRRSLGRAVSQYIGTSSGGARSAAARMGSSRHSGSRLLGFLSDAATRGASEALRALNLGSLVGRPIEQVFLGLADYVCPDGGSVDEGIARSAFIETIANLADAGITDLDSLSVEQIQTVFELYAANAIEARLCNDIGAHIVTFPGNADEATRVQAQLHDFILRGVADALITAQTTIQALTPDRVLGFVGHIYEQAFSILQTLAEAEAEAP